jgi:ATP-dependent RNA helicase DeaD
LFINLGAVDDFTRGDLLGYICNNTGISGRSVGKIDMKGVFSFFEVETEFVEKVTEAFKPIDFHGRDVRIEVSGDATSEGGERRSGGGGYGGGERRSGGGGYGGGERRSSGGGERRSSGGGYGGGERRSGGGGERRSGGSSSGGGFRDFSGKRKDEGGSSSDSGNRRRRS